LNRITIFVPKFKKMTEKEILAIEEALFEDARLSEYDEKHLTNVLSRIHIANFQGIKELTIEGLPLNARWIFLTGENGFGKTSILRAIAKGFVGDENFVLPMPENTKIFLNGFIKNKPFISKTPDKQNIKIPIATYGVSRFQLTANDQTASDRSQQKTYSLFHDDGQLINIEQELITTFAYDEPRFEQLRNVFLQIIPNLKDIKIDTANGKPKVRYYEKDEYNNGYEAVSLNELAAGYRSILTMIGDMVIRLSDVNSLIGEVSGIVLIDELDAHLHPKYQYELPKLLSDVFPNIQFIVTTHSPIPILGLPEDNKPVILTVERSPEKGITVDRKDDDFDIRQLNPEALLTSPIFNFQTIFARGAKHETIIPTSDFKEVIEVEAIKKRLKNLREAGLVK
jgi:predicted ATP-binding protein involved in virulence